MSRNKIIKNDKEYKSWLKELKSKVRTAQIKAAVKVNTELLKFYWEFGNEIIEKQKTTSWGDGFLKQLSKDLSMEFPDIKGFSIRNLELIRNWFLYWFTNFEKTKQLVSQLNNEEWQLFQEKDKKISQLASEFYSNLIFNIPWGHNLVIISKSNTVEESLFYVQKTLENGWSRNVLIHQIASGLFERELKEMSNNE